MNVFFMKHTPQTFAYGTPQESFVYDIRMETGYDTHMENVYDTHMETGSDTRM